MSHVIVDMELSLVSEKFELEEVKVMKEGEEVVGELHKMHRKIQQFVSNLLKTATDDFHHNINNAIERGDMNAEFPLRKRVCISIVD